MLSGKRCHKNLFNVEATIRNNTEMPYVSGKHLVKKVKNGYSQEERINVSDKKTAREGCPLVRGTSVREKDLTSSE